MALPSPSPDATALITGASSGIGMEVARQLARRGHGVTLVARRKEKLEELANELRASHGIRAEAVGRDLGEALERDGLVGDLERLGLRVAVLVNNAGFGSGAPFVKLDRERELSMLRLNCEAVVDLCGTRPRWCRGAPARSSTSHRPRRSSRSPDSQRTPPRRLWCSLSARPFIRNWPARE
jgi:short-subunit dehydrogenase